MIMQHKNSWLHNLRFKLFALCAIMLLGQGLFIRPVLASDFSVISRGAGKLDLFVQRNGAIWMKSFNGGWSNWSNLGKAPTGENFLTVSAVAAGNNRWDIFATPINSAANKLVWHLGFDGTFLWSWESMGSVGNAFVDGVQAVSTGNGRINLFTRDTSTLNGNTIVGDATVQWKSWTASGGWKPSQTGWSTLDNTMSPLSFHALAHSGNRIDLFRKSDSNKAIGRKAYNGTAWGPANPFTHQPLNSWTEMNGEANRTPYAVSWGTNRIDVFVRGSDDNVYINNTDNAGSSWWGWGFLGRGDASGSGGGAVSAVAWEANRLDIFTNESGNVYHKTWTGTDWWPSQTDWEDIGDNPTNYSYPPLPVSWGPSRIDLFMFQQHAPAFVGTPSTSSLYHKWTDGNGWGPSQTEWENLGPDPDPSP
jgi:hypothetical protein